MESKGRPALAIVASPVESLHVVRSNLITLSIGIGRGSCVVSSILLPLQIVLARFPHRLMERQRQSPRCRMQEREWAIRLAFIAVSAPVWKIAHGVLSSL
jgi:hypothetical protein